MKKTYQNPQIVVCDCFALELMQASGVFGNGTANDITYGGVDYEGSQDPAAKYSVWDE